MSTRPLGPPSYRLHASSFPSSCLMLNTSTYFLTRISSQRYALCVSKSSIFLLLRSPLGVSFTVSKNVRSIIRSAETFVARPNYRRYFLLNFIFLREYRQNSKSRMFSRAVRCSILSIISSYNKITAVLVFDFFTAVFFFFGVVSS